MIAEIVIAVGDVDEAVTFYSEVCGFTHVRTVVVSGRPVAELDAGGQRVSLVPAPSASVHLVVPTDDAGRSARRLRRRAVAIAEDAPVEVDGGRWVAFRDPWGNALGMFEPVEDDTP